MLRDRDTVFGISRAVNGVFGVGFLGERRVGICAIGTPCAKETDVVPAPAVIGRVLHANGEVLAGGHGAETHPLLTIFIEANEVFSFKRLGGRLSGLIVSLFEPAIVENVGPSSGVLSALLADGERTRPRAHEKLSRGQFFFAGESCVHR